MVLVLEHTADGAMGVVLNRTAEVRVSDVVPALADLPDADELVRLGGPVSPESVVALGDFERPEEAGTSVVGTLGTLDPDGSNESLRRLRVYAGYAGWGPGQLDTELEQDAWIVVAAREGDPFGEDDIWSEAVGRKGGSYRLLATMPTDPTVN